MNRINALLTIIASVLLFHATTVDARSFAYYKPLNQARVLRALKAAEWLWTKSKRTKPVHPREMPLLVLTDWLPGLAVKGTPSALQQFDKKAVQFGYKTGTSSPFQQWNREFEQVLLTWDAILWKITSSQRKQLQQQWSRLNQTNLTNRQKRQKAALGYKIRLSFVTPTQKRVVLRHKRRIQRFLKSIQLR